MSTVGARLPLTAERARIFRITHVHNLGWMLRNGICCRSGAFDPDYRNIGNPELIEKRASRHVPIPPGGSLKEYIPFYFTSRSPMLLNIKTGRNVPAIPMEEIIVLVASLQTLKAREIPFVFTDRHAALAAARFSANLAELNGMIDWTLLQNSDFSSDPEDPGKKERYQAEALVYQEMPFDALDGVLAYDDGQKARVEAAIRDAGLAIPVHVDRRYYV